MRSLLERLLGDDRPDEQVDLEARRARADDALRERVHCVEDCAVPGVAVVNQGPDGEPIVVPIARFSLGEDVENPDADRVWRLVPDALRTLHRAFDDVFVRHYDVQFTFAGDGLFEAEDCRRIAVLPEYAERLATKPGFDGTALRELVLEEDDIDDEIAPVAWGECRDYSDRDDAAIVAATAAVASTMTYVRQYRTEGSSDRPVYLRPGEERSIHDPTSRSPLSSVSSSRSRSVFRLTRAYCSSSTAPSSGR